MKTYKPRIGDSYYVIYFDGREYISAPRVYQKDRTERDIKSGNYFPNKTQSDRAILAINNSVKKVFADPKFKEKI